LTNFYEFFFNTQPKNPERFKMNSTDKKEINKNNERIYSLMAELNTTLDLYYDNTYEFEKDTNEKKSLVT
tara:strand:- start:352 stop:561 length:210 start_codon:yes stop_codon:yes gene_type:complete